MRLLFLAWFWRILRRSDGNSVHTKALDSVTQFFIFNNVIVNGKVSSSNSARAPPFLKTAAPTLRELSV